MVKFSNPFKLFPSYCIKNKILSQFSKIGKPVIAPFSTFASTFSGDGWSIFGLSGQLVTVAENLTQIDRFMLIRLTKSTDRAQSNQKLQKQSLFANLTFTRLDVNFDVIIVFGSFEIKKVQLLEYSISCRILNTHIINIIKFKIPVVIFSNYKCFEN